MSDFKALVAKVATGKALSMKQSRAAFDVMMSGEASQAQMGAFLMALRVRGETVDEITGAASIMRDKVLPVAAPDDAIDIVGTGGDGAGTYNISTCAALVAAACGLSVAKHGNRALSSKSGAADVLAALGVNIEIGPDRISECITKAGVGFMFAPAHHSAMRHVGPTRVEMGIRTIFNLLGPLSNPAGVKRLVVGVFSADWVEPLAHVLKNLGATRVWVVHGDGLDELTTTGPTRVASLENDEVTVFDVTPKDAGLPEAKLTALKGGEAAKNSEALSAVLAGKPGAYRDIVLLNTAAALIVSGKAKDLENGAARAAEAIDSGRARQHLDTLIRVSNQKT